MVAFSAPLEGDQFVDTRARSAVRRASHEPQRTYVLAEASVRAVASEPNEIIVEVEPDPSPRTDGLYRKLKKLELIHQGLGERLSAAEHETSVLRNRYNTLVGKVRRARSQIGTLNSSTPYRPGAIERTFQDILEGLDNV